MGSLESAHLLVGFIVTRELETDRNALGHDTTGALFSVQNLFELLKERGGRAGGPHDGIGRR
jgi:hypothetical protein